MIQIFLTMIILFTRKRFSRGMGQTPLITGVPQILKVDFDEPIIVPAGIKRILVSIESMKISIILPRQNCLLQVQKKIMVNRGMLAVAYDIISTKDFTNPPPNANFYINVTGDVLIQRVQVL
jgi:hypothetical protein